MNVDELLRDLAVALTDTPERGAAELREEYFALCRRVDSDPLERQRVNAIADRLEQEAGLPRQGSAAPALIPGRAVSRAADDAVHVANSLAAPGLDLRTVNDDRRTETSAAVARLTDLLARCPAGAYGAEASAMILAAVTAVAETLIANRDERAALVLIQAAYPQVRFFGRRHPDTFGLRRARAEALSELGHRRPAELLLRLLSADEQQQNGRDDPRTALLLLWTLVKGGKLDEAEAGFRALTARLAQPKETPPGDEAMMLRWHVQCRHAWLLTRQGLAAGSAASYDGVIIDRSQELGLDHSDTSDARHSKGKARVFSGEGALALTLLETLAADRARIQGDRHSDTLETVKYLHLARVQAGPRDDRVLGAATDGLREILRIQVRRHGPGHPMSRDTADWLGTLRRLADAVRFGEPVPGLGRIPAPERQIVTLDEPYREVSLL